MTGVGSGAGGGLLRQLLIRATALRQAGRLAESLEPMRQAVGIAPHSAPLRHDFGLALLQCGQPDEAIAAFRQAVRIDPRFADAHWRLGMALEQQGATDEALSAYERACRLTPRLAHAQFRRGVILETSGRRTEAIAAYEAAVAAAEHLGLRSFARVRLLLLQDLDSEAEIELRDWVGREPDNADANQLLGMVQSQAGRFEEALVSYQRALEKAPGRVEIYYDLVRCRRLNGDDRALIDRMRKAEATLVGRDSDRCKLHLALGKALEDLGDYEGAMRHFDEGYEAHRRVTPFDLATFETLVSRIMSTFGRSAPADDAETRLPTAGPVMVLGMPRSGTTLMEQILSSHPEVTGAGELRFWPRRGEIWQAAGAPSSEPRFARAAATDYIAYLAKVAPGAARIVDKNPFNFIWAGLIHQALPHTAIVHCRRRPIDTALSVHQTYFNPRLSFPTGGTDLVGYYRAYERLMAHWRAVLPPDRFLEVDYEELVEAPEPIIRRVLAFCGLPWDDACLHPEMNDRPVKTPSRWQARQPVYKSSRDRWRLYEPWLGPLAALV